MRKEVLENLKVRQIVNYGVLEILLDNGYNCEIKSEDLMLVTLKEIDTKVILIKEGDTLIIQQELVGIKELAEDIKLYKELLDFNTEILPVSIAIDSTNEENPKLVINESLNIENMDSDELIRVFEAIEIHMPKVVNIIKKYTK